MSAISRRRSRASRFLMGWLILWMGLWSWAPAAAEEIGSVRKVRSEVLAIEAGKTPRQLHKSDPLERGLRVRLTKRDSSLLAHFYGFEKDVPYRGPQDIRIKEDYRIEGVVRLAGMSEMEMGQKSFLDRIVTTVDVEWGEFRAWLRPGRNHDIEGSTREVSSLKFNGTAVRVLAAPGFGTFVGVDEGIATVQAVAGGDPVEVRSGQWVLVPPGGLPTRPAPLDRIDILEDPPLLLQDFTTEPPRSPQ